MDGTPVALVKEAKAYPNQSQATGRTRVLSYFQQLRAQHRLKSALSPFRADLKQVETDFFKFLPELTPSATKALTHVAKSGGKRIRPAVFYAASRLFPRETQSQYCASIAVVCEYVHTASLLHDDVIDSSSLRRGRTTVNSLWGDQSAVLVGDLLYSRASELMAATGSIEVVSTFAHAIREMSEGELIQLENLFKTTCKTVYFDIMAKKTASLLSACCRVAGILAGGETSQIEALERFGYNLGFAFQLVDDALDYMEVGDSIGKPNLSDLKDGKITYPILALLEVASAEDVSVVKTLLKTIPASDADIQRLSSLVRKYQTDRLTVELAASYTEKAKESVEMFGASQGYGDLVQFSESLNCRHF